MDTPFEDSNLAAIGSDADKAAREAAAKLEVNWEGAGQSEGIEIWRVENKRDEETGNPDFGIEPWPKKHYGEFFEGDSYIVLKTAKDPENDSSFMWDIFFWIGAESSQDEYGVAAYKANELDDLLGDAPVQHRETQGYESEDFMECFPKGGIRYLKGGVDSGFRDVETDGGTMEALPTRLFHVRKTSRKTVSYLVELSFKSLNDGDAFVVDAHDVVYTWYGAECSPFEKSKAAEVAHNIVQTRGGHAKFVQDVGNDDEAFWELLGGKQGDIPSAESYTDDDVPSDKATTMFILRETDSFLKVEKVDTPSKSLLTSDIVAMMDVGSEVFVWMGKDSPKRLRQQASMGVQSHLKNFSREHNTVVTNVMEGKESRCRNWKKAFA